MARKTSVAMGGGSGMNEYGKGESKGRSAIKPELNASPLLDALNFPACILGLRGDVLYANRWFKQFFIENGNAVSLDLSHPFSPEYRKRMALAYTRALKGEERQCFAVMKTSDVKKMPVEIYLFPMHQDEEIVSILCFIKPVGDDRLASFDQSTSALMDSEENAHIRSIFDFSPFPIVRIARNGNVLNGSASIETLFGYLPEEFMKSRTTLFKSMSLYDFERMRKALADIFDGNVNFKRLGEIRVVTKEKEERWVNATIYPIVVNREVEAVDVILEDITRLRMLENRLSVMSKVQIIGDLTKGILHSFNNMINIIMSRTQLLLQMAEREIVTEGLKVIERTAFDTAKQIRRVESFIGEGEALGNPQEEDLIDLIEDAIEFAKIHFKVEQKEKKRVVRIERRYFSLINVKTDTRMLREIIVSMIFKVSTFLGEEGTINVLLRDNGAISLTVLAKREPEIREDLGALGSLVFSEIDVRRIAEKLKIKIIEEESITSYSVKAVLPQGIVISKNGKGQSSIEYRLRDHDIIIVEDEVTLKQILYELFDSMGNRVFVCESGDEALAEFKKNSYDIVIADYGIKGITGLELLVRVKEINDQVLTVLLSGWMLGDLRSYKNVIDLYLPKPYKLDVLIREISKIDQARQR